jgi:hypothetical protein
MTQTKVPLKIPVRFKFLSGDPLITDPMNGQRYNRYSYVLNNPTNLIDPSGFCETTTGSYICGGGAGGSKLEIIPGDPYGTEKYWVGNMIESLIEKKGQLGSASARTEAAEKGVKGRKILPDDPEAPLTDSDKSALRDGLAAQQAMANAMLTSLKRWNNTDREIFSSVFGRADGASRNFIQEIARRELQAGSEMTTDNFKHATWADFNYRDPKGKYDPSYAYAFVKNEDFSHRIYLGGLWTITKSRGPFEVGALIVHELSHFDDVGYSSDGYGRAYRGSINSPRQMEELRRDYPDRTLQHSYSIENYARGASK